MAVGAKVATAYVDLVARTESFKAAINEATVLSKKFASEMKGQMGEARGSMMLLGEEIGVHIPRHLQAALVKFELVSKVASMAFPLVGAVAFGEVVFEAGEKLMEFAKKNEDAARKNAEVWRGIEQPLQHTNDQLQLANDKLANSIAKLEHKPTNGLKEAIDEAILSADTLGEKLNVDVQKLVQVLDAQNKSKWNPLNWGDAGSSDISDHAHSYQTDQEGIDIRSRAQLQQLRQQNASEEAIASATKKFYEEKKLRADQEQQWADAQLKEAVAKQNSAGGANLMGRADQTGRIQSLTHYDAAVGQQSDFIGLSQKNEEQTATFAKLQSAQTAASEAKSAAAKQLEQWKTDLTAMHALHIMSLDEDAHYWQNLADNPKNSKPARVTALAEANKDRAGAMKQFQQQNFSGWMSDASDQQRQKTESDRITEAITAEWSAGQKADDERSKLLAKAAREAFEGTAGEIQAAEKIAEASIQLQHARGALSDHAAALAMQYVHDSSDSKYQSAVTTAGDAGAGIGPREAERHNQQYGLQQLVDAQAVLSSTWSGMVNNVFDELIKKSQDTQQQIEHIALQMIDSINGELAKGMTGHGMDFGKIFEQTSQQLSKTALERIEGLGLQALGLGSGKKADGSAENPFHVVGPGGAGGNSSGIAGAASKGLMGMFNDSDWFSSLFGGKLFGSGSAFGGGHALGGLVMAGVPIDVGELGRERFTPMVPGRITPHNQMGGGGDTYHIDARGTDPALTQANVMRAVAHARDQGAALGARMVAERSRRTAQ